MSELKDRARELAEQMGGECHGEEFSFPSMVNLKVIEQGLMRERRLAFEEAAKMCVDRITPTLAETNEQREDCSECGISPHGISQATCFHFYQLEKAMLARSAAEREK